MTNLEMIERIDRLPCLDDVTITDLFEIVVDLRSYLTTLSAAHTIKPLVWEDGDKATSCLNYRVFYCYGDKTFRAYNNGKLLSVCSSLAHGKQLCQQHWESKAGIGKYLERVK